MRVGFITGEYPPMSGGIADYTAILGRELRALGHEIFILTNPAAQPSPPDEIHVTPTVRQWNRAFFKAVKSWAADHRLDLVNLQYQTAAFGMAGLIHFLPLRLRPLPFITTFHDLRFPYLFPKAGFLRPWVVRQLAQHSDGVIVTNRGDERRLRAEVNPRHLIQIPLGTTVKVGAPISPESCQRIRQRALGDDQSALLVAHFGFVNHTKGVDTLLRAIRLAQEDGAAVHLMMIGERLGASDPTNAAFARQIDALCAELGIAPYWTGFVSEADAASYFAAADVLALPFKDGASLRRTSLQAGLAHGCAIVTTRPTDDDLSELQQGEHVLYVPADDPRALADALIRLAAEPALRAKLRDGAKAAAQQFRWDQIAARTLAFYENVLNS